MNDDVRLTLHPRFTHLVSAGDRAVLVGDDDFMLVDEAVVRDVIRLTDGTQPRHVDDNSIIS